MRRAGQMDLVVSLTYVLLLGTIGGIMLNESLATLRAARSGGTASRVRPVNHVWIHGLPLQDALPPVAALYQRHPAAA